MKFTKIFVLFFLLSLISSCSNEQTKKSVIEEKNLELQVLEAYREGMKSLEAKDVLFAAKKFNEAEILFPQSEWAPRSALMAAYSYYTQNYYKDSIAELERFLRIYPNHKDSAYAEYLIALSYYEQIVDEKKDLNSIKNSKEVFSKIIEKYPDTDFAIDAKFKINLVDTILASKEMYVGRYYFDRNKWIASINRFKFVIDNYETTIYTEEALHRLVEIYYLLGLEAEAKKYANLLGYNYQSSKWYQQSYSIFDKNYQIIEIKKDENSILKILKTLLNVDE